MTHDPDKPKQPLTPYFLFLQENREIIRKKYPQMTISQIGILGGKIWGQLSEKDKQKYKDQYYEERREY